MRHGFLVHNSYRYKLYLYSCATTTAISSGLRGSPAPGTCYSSSLFIGTPIGTPPPPCFIQHQQRTVSCADADEPAACWQICCSSKTGRGCCHLQLVPPTTCGGDGCYMHATTQTIQVAFRSDTCRRAAVQNEKQPRVSVRRRTLLRLPV